jgi:hypothetical protein
MGPYCKFCGERCFVPTTKDDIIKTDLKATCKKGVAYDLVKTFKDYTEEMWFLGTDFLEEKDLELMSSGVDTSFTRDEGAIYGVNDSFESYSDIFRAIMIEAFERGYFWVFFDRDIETQLRRI